ncbi:MAG: FtsX-like permease family protein [Desulfobacterales bacterium]|nr:MAG: FtsX-like permease family protein [Desulfobacterales bacterium]
MNSFQTVIRLALRDYFYERLLSACAIMGLAAVLAPLLVLFGVKSGIINTMSDRLIQDPRNREISPVGSGRYGTDWFSAMRDRPDVAFVIPQTRSIAASMILYNKNSTNPRTLVVSLIPTAEGDPLLEIYGRISTKNTQVVLSEPVARKLNVKAGQRVLGQVGRSVAGVKEQVAVDLQITAVLPLGAFSREAAFVRLELLEATEDYRDGRGSKTFGWTGSARPTGPRVYPSFRLYARSIYDVADLRNMLMDQGLEVYTKAEDIETVKSLDRSFNLIFSLIAVVAVLGYFASMVSNVLANVNRKSRYLGISSLIGFSTGNIIWYPMLQSIATSILGFLTAVILYRLVETLINGLFSDYLSTGEYVCRLSVGHMLIALVLTLTLAVLASAYGAFRVSRIEPSEVIREV